MDNIVTSNVTSPLSKTWFGRIKYAVTMGSIVALFGLVAVAPQVSWSAEPEVELMFQPGEMPTQEIIAAAAAEAELLIDSLEVETLPEPEPEPEPVQEVQTQSRQSVTQATPQPVAPPTYSGGGSPEAWMSAAGIDPANWGYVDYIATRESGWNPNATNPTSGACGLIQAYPCSKVPGSGYNPVDNLSWANGYAVGRYGSWAAAYDFWTSNHWW